MPGKRGLLLFKKETPLQLGIISSKRFASDDTTIPDPPIPPPPEISDIQVVIPLTEIHIYTIFFAILNSCITFQLFFIFQI